MVSQQTQRFEFFLSLIYFLLLKASKVLESALQLKPYCLALFPLYAFAILGKYLQLHVLQVDQ